MPFRVKREILIYSNDCKISPFGRDDNLIKGHYTSNIAEGYGRKTTSEYIRFLYIAYGSNCELETQLLLSGDLSYIETGKLEILLQGIREVERMLKALIKSLEKKHSTP